MPAKGRRARSESGVAVDANVSLAKLARGRRRIDTLLVVGGVGSRPVTRDEVFLRDLASVARRARRVASVCTGALLLAAAGLLDGYEATTHWASCSALADAHPRVRVRADRIYVRDRDRWTSAGVTAGIDLFLAVVEQDHGAELAHAVAGWLVVFVRRPGGQSQFSAQLRAEPATTPSIVELQRWLPDHLGEDLGVDALATRVGMSPRTFARVFRRETILRYLRLCSDGYSFSSTSLLLLLHEGHPVAFVPVDVTPAHRRGRVTVRTGFDTVVLLLRITTLLDPLRIFLPLSLVLFIAGIAWGTPYAVAGHGVSVGALLLLLTAVLLFGVGLVSDQIAELRKEWLER